MLGVGFGFCAKRCFKVLSTNTSAASSSLWLVTARGIIRHAA